MKIRILHKWNLSPRRAIGLQEELRTRVITKCASGKIRTVAGADLAIDVDAESGVAAVIVFSYPDMKELTRVVARAPIRYPYIPGLLSFRECPVLLKAFEKLPVAPDVVLFDGQGIAHPRGLGLASHMGLWLDLPTIGCAKSRLIGKHDEPGPNVGDFAPLLYEGRRTKDVGRGTRDAGRFITRPTSNVPRPSSIVGTVLRTRKGVKPIYVSIGHKIDLKGAVDIVVNCLDRTRIPKPTREADRIVKQHPSAISNQLSAFSGQLGADSRQPTADSRQLTADS